ncbi:hypothetical protein HYW55_01370 [Candidatus Gottesmanbacteria bacterium]|nr:hypothetical protein [Candidatus Gottesmanbacteria bacterium]
MKTIVTHFAPDVDAISSVWLLKRFTTRWQEADVAFVPAGKTLKGDIVDSDPSVMHVDTGMGMLDHHQTDEDTCAAKRTLEYVRELGEGKVRIHQKHADDALDRMIDVVNDIDHFREVYFPNPAADYYDFGLVAILDGWKLLYPEDDGKIATLGMLVLDGIYKKFQDKVWAEHELSQNGIAFESKWGKGIAIETINDEVVKMAQRQGFVLAVRKDPKKGYVRIKAIPSSDADLTIYYKKLKKKDPKATWYLHASRKMLLNGSVKNPESQPSSLQLSELLKILTAKKKKKMVQ